MNAKNPIVHIYGAAGARAAVLSRYPRAVSRRNGAYGERWPIYVIVAGKITLGVGHGVSAAWTDAANKIWGQ